MSKSNSGDAQLAPVAFLPWVGDGQGVAQAPDAAVSDFVGSAPVNPGPGNSAFDALAAVERDFADTEAEILRIDTLIVRRLGRRGLSSWEVTELLRENGVAESDVHGWIGRYECLGYIDDHELAYQLVQTHHVRKGLGRSAVAQELKTRHIDPVIIESALSEIDPDDELERATELAVKRAGQLTSYDKETASRRLNAFLMRKGYSSGVVRQAVDTAMEPRAGERRPSASSSGANGKGGGVRFR